MNNNLSKLWSKAVTDSNRELFVSDWSTSSIWGPMESLTDDQLLDIADYVGRVWDAAHMTTKDIIKSTGMSQAAFAEHFCIPKRTVESWCMGDRKPPDYVRLMMAQLIKLI